MYTMSDKTRRIHLFINVCDFIHDGKRYITKLKRWSGRIQLLFIILKKI